jgi:uncharacterized protein
MASPLKSSIRDIKEKGSLWLSGVVAGAKFQESLRGQASIQGNVSVEMLFSWRNDQAFFKGRASGSWELECSRCLAPRKCQYSTSVEGKAEGSNETADATEELRQALVLAVPMRVICSSDCRGLCQQCGGNRNLRDCGCA